MEKRIDRADYERHMKIIVKAIDEALNGAYGGPEEATGFMLVVFPAGEPEKANYLSAHIDRMDAVIALRGLAKDLEGAPNGRTVSR